eukprot:10784878-Lingulodinium_polyedra.AAC.1
MASACVRIHEHTSAPLEAVVVAVLEAAAAVAVLEAAVAVAALEAAALEASAMEAAAAGCFPWLQAD